MILCVYVYTDRSYYRIVTNTFYSESEICKTMLEPKQKRKLKRINYTNKNWLKTDNNKNFGYEAI